MVSTELFGRSRPEIQWIGASKCVPVCSPHEKLFQYQPGPRSSYFETSSMRKGQHWPISGGSAICGNSGVSVCVRSTTRMRPVLRAPTRTPRISAVDINSSVIVMLLLRSLFQEHRGTGFAGPLVLPPVGGGRLHEVSQPGGELHSSSCGEL